MGNSFIHAGTPVRVDSASLGTIDSRQLIAAHRALSGLEHAVQFAPASAADSFRHTVWLLDGLGAVQLDGEPILMKTIIEEPNNRAVQCALTYASIASSIAYLENPAPITQSMALHIADRLSGENSLLTSLSVPTASASVTVRRDVGSNEVLQHGLAHWEHFVSDGAGDQDSLVMSAIADAKLRRLSPFTTNNNASASLLFDAILRDEQILYHAPLCVSNYFSRHAHDFFLALPNDGAVIRFYLTAFTELALELVSCLARLVKHVEHCRIVIKESLPRAPLEIVMQAVCRPLCTNNDLIQAGISRRQTSASYLKKLAKEGVLVSHRAGKELRYVNTGIIQAFNTIS